MVGDQLNLVEVSVEKDAGGNPTCIIWPDGRRFAISSSGAPLMCPSRTAGRFAYVRDVYVRSREQDAPQVDYRRRRQVVCRLPEVARVFRQLGRRVAL